MFNTTHAFTGEYFFLSNMFNRAISVDGVTYKTSEHYYQCMKCQTLEDYNLVFDAPSPFIAKKIGKRVKLIPNWDNMKDTVMLKAIFAKFTQHTDLRLLLCNTAPLLIVEFNYWGDTYWGVSNGVGLNKLGVMLTKLRGLLNESN